jgi:hypothetical protein
MEDVSFTSLNSASSNELESDLGRDALREICCSSLSRILDLPDNQLEILLGDNDDSSRQDTSVNVAKNIANKFKALSHRLKFDDHSSTAIGPSHVTLHFGSPISTDSQSVLLQLMSFMESFADEEGIFRKPGSHSRVEQLTRDLETLPFDRIITNETFTPPDYASVLKAFFNGLSEPLMLLRHGEAYRQASMMASDVKRTLCLQLLMLLLPPTHHIILTHLLHLLSLISQSHDSKMDAHNLALVFGPTLFFNTKDDNFSPEMIPIITSLLEHMILNNVEIFEVPSEVRLVAEKYLKRKETCKDDDGGGAVVPVDIYSSACKKSCDVGEYHQKGQDMANAELASLYEYVKNMPDGPQKQHFLKKFENNSKLAGTPPPFTKSKKTKENRHTPKISLHHKGIVKSHETATPMRPSFNKKSLSDSNNITTNTTNSSSVHVYATPLKPKAALKKYHKYETDV